MPIPRPLLATAFAVAVLGAAAACTPLEFNTLTDGATRDQPITEVRIDGGSGDVSVVTDDAVKGVDLVRTVRYRGTAPGATYHFDGTVLSLDTECGVNCGVSYKVRVPPRGSGPGVTVSGKNSSGNITTRGTGAVDVTLTSGDIDIADVDATVSARSTSGNVTLLGIGGNVVVHASSGDVHGTDLRGGTST